MKLKIVTLFLLFASFIGAQNFESICNIGAVTQNSAVICAKFSGTGIFSVNFSTNPSMSPFATISNNSIDPSSFTGEATLVGLAANSTYYYEVLSGNQSNIFSFKTLPANGQNVSIAAVSCQQDGNNSSFAQLAAKNPDIVVHLGDYGYTDSYNVNTLRNNYSNQSNGTDWAINILQKFPVERIWDDHDFGPNDSNGKNPAKTNSYQAFEEWNAHYPYASPNQGIWRSSKVNDVVEMFFTDSRYQRKEPADIEQLNLTASITDCKFSGLPIQPDGYYERWYVRIGSDYFKVIDYTGGIVELDYNIPNVSGASIYMNNASLLDAYNSVSDQDRWLVDEVNGSTSEWKLIFSTSPMNPTISATDPAGSDTWGGFDANDMELNYLMQRIDRKNVVIASGDRHFVAIDDGTNVGWAELLSSPIDNKNSFIGKHGTWSEGAFDTDDYFGIIEFSTTQAILTNYNAAGNSVQTATIERQVEDLPTAPLASNQHETIINNSDTLKVCRCK